MEPKLPENLIIPMALVQAIGTYILSQPCQNAPVNEAYKLIEALKQLQPLQAKEEPKQ